MMRQLTAIGCVIFFLLTVSCGHNSGSPAPATKTAHLKWDQVTTYTNGDAIILGGYKIRQGNASRVYNKTYTVAVGDLKSAATPTFDIPGLTKGTYYFCVTAFDQDGVESGLSLEVSGAVL